MRIKAFLAICAACGFIVGCALPTSIYAVEVTNQARYDADFAACVGYAKNAPKNFSLSSIASGTISGAGSNAAVNPLLGAAGGLAASTAKAVDVFNTTQRGILVDCVRQKTARDLSALVLEPTQ